MNFKQQTPVLLAIDWDRTDLPPLTQDSACIWRVSIDRFPNRFSALEKILHPDEIDQARRYLHLSDQKRYLIGKIMLRLLLSSYLNIRPKDVYFYKGVYGKPYTQMPKPPQVHFNIAHSGNWVLLCLALSDVGIDVEKINLGFDYASLLERCFCPLEIRRIETNPHQALQHFYVLWTRKEAVLKHSGLGLRASLQSLNVLADIPAKGIQVHSFISGPQYISSVCCAAHIRRFLYREGDLSGLKF